MSIELNPEIIALIYGFPVTNSLLTTLLVTALLASLSLYFYFRGRNSKGILMSGIKILIFNILKLTDEVTGDRKISKKILPLIATFFLFIVTANLLALIPGFLGSFFVRSPAGNIPLLRSPNSDLNTTLALAAFSVISGQIFSFRILGPKIYIRRFINLSGPVKFVLGFFEMISEVIRLLSFSFRLFGNIFAGEVLLLVIAFLIPYIIPLPFMIFEVFVAVIQAFIFAMLTLAFIQTGLTESRA
jgi:F-type H+-transporting ATPase subunit a